MQACTGEEFSRKIVAPLLEMAAHGSCFGGNLGFRLRGGTELVKPLTEPLRCEGGPPAKPDLNRVSRYLAQWRGFDAFGAISKLIENKSHAKHHEAGDDKYSLQKEALGVLVDSKRQGAVLDVGARFAVDDLVVDDGFIDKHFVGEIIGAVQGVAVRRFVVDAHVPKVADTVFGPFVKFVELGETPGGAEEVQKRKQQGDEGGKDLLVILGGALNEDVEDNEGNGEENDENVDDPLPPCGGNGFPLRTDEIRCIKHCPREKGKQVGG